MDSQSHTHASYSHYSEDRRQNVLPSISSRLHYNPNILYDATRTRQPASMSSNYALGSAITHTAYDPVHDAYDLPRISANNASQSPTAYAQEVHPGSERNDMYDYNAPGRFDNSATLPPIKNLHQHQHSLYRHAHGSDALSYRSPAHPQPVGHDLHSFHIQAASHAVSTSSAALQNMTYTKRSDDTSTPYKSLAPLSIPVEVTSAEGKSGSKRIVMACHQCRSRKIRCDASRPACANCVRRHEDCQYDAKPKRRGPDKVPGSRMRSCKSRKQSMGEDSPSSPPGTLRSEASTTFFSSPAQQPSSNA